MKKLKKYFVSLFISILLVPCICLSMVVNAADPVTVVVAVGEALLNTITIISDNQASEPFNGQDYDRIVEFANGQSVKHDIDKNLGLTNITLSSYTFISGKYCMQSLDDNGDYRQYMCQVSMYYNDGFNTDNSDTIHTVEDASGNIYIANNVYFDIFRDDGSHKRYRYICSDSLTMSQQFNTSSWAGYTGNLTNYGVTIHRTTNSKYYDVTSGDTIGTLMDWSAVNRDINLRYRDDNCIWIDTNSNTVNSSYRCRYIRWFMNKNGYYTLALPTDEEICLGLIHAKSPSGTWNTTPSYTLGFYTTNSNDNKQVYERNFGSSKSNTFIYNYDDSFVGGTVIDNSNKTTVLNGAFETSFDANGNVIMPIDLDAKLMPLIDASLNNIEGKVNNFFDDMPDFGNNWNNRNPDNNYFDLDYPLPPAPPTTGDITVLVTVDVSRPLVPEFTTSSRWLYIDVGNLTTTVEAIPPQYVSAAQTLQNKTDDIFDELEMIPIYLGLAIFGVAVSILMKGA